MAGVNINDSIGYRIRKQRLNNGMTQEELAEVMCIPKSTISAYENDKVDIKSSVIVELSHILSTTPNYFLGASNEIDSITEGIITLICKMKDDRLKNLLYDHIRALSELSL